MAEDVGTTVALRSRDVVLAVIEASDVRAPANSALRSTSHQDCFVQPSGWLRVNLERSAADGAASDTRSDKIISNWKVQCRQLLRSCIEQKLAKVVEGPLRRSDC